MVHFKSQIIKRRKTHASLECSKYRENNFKENENNEISVQQNCLPGPIKLLSTFQ